MKTTLFVFCLLLATSAFAQYAGSPNVLNSQPFVFEESGHPAQASFTPMASERSVLGGTGYSFAQGDRPASDFPQQPQASLGDTARELRKQHEQLARKAKVVWTNQ